MLQAAELGKRYGTRWIFRKISFSLLPADCLVVEGRNGSGKSTLIKVLAGLLPASEGSVLWPRPDVRSCVGCSALDASVYPELTVFEHLTLTAKLRGCPARETDLLNRVGLAYASKVAAKELSTGMRARLKLAIAIQPDPMALLLDEPSAGLDQEGLDALSQVIQDQLKAGCVVLATNDPTEKRFATHMLEMGH